MLKVFFTVGEEGQLFERDKERAVVDFPNETGREVVCRDSLGRLLFGRWGGRMIGADGGGAPGEDWKAVVCLLLL